MPTPASSRSPSARRARRHPTAMAAAAAVLVVLTCLSGFLAGLPSLVAETALFRGAAASSAAASAGASTPGSVEDDRAAASPDGAAIEAPPALAADLSASAMRLRWESPSRGPSESFRSRLRARIGRSADAPPAETRPALRPPYDPVEGRSARSSSLRLLLQTAQLAAG